MRTRQDRKGEELGCAVLDAVSAILISCRVKGVPAGINFVPAASNMTIIHCRHQIAPSLPITKGLLQAPNTIISGRRSESFLNRGRENGNKAHSLPS